MGALLLLGAELSQRDEPRGDGRLREGPGAVAAAPCVPAVLRQTRCCKAPDFRPRAPAPSASIPARDRDRPCRARFEDRALLVRSRWGTRRLRGHRRAASTGRMSTRRPRCLTRRRGPGAGPTRVPRPRSARSALSLNGRVRGHGRMRPPPAPKRRRFSRTRLVPPLQAPWRPPASP